MKPKSIPPPQYWWTGDAAEWVAQQLGLRHDYGMQDWPYEVSEAKDLDRYFQLYGQLDAQVEASVRVVLMELILDAADGLVDLEAVWPQIKGVLDQDGDILSRTAMYWCCWNTQEQNLEEEAWRIAPYLRTWWRENYPIPTEAELEDRGLFY